MKINFDVSFGSAEIQGRTLMLLLVRSKHFQEPGFTSSYDVWAANAPLRQSGAGVQQKR